MITLKRAQIRRGVEGIDVTVKSAKGLARAFAPTWEMVMGHKQGTLTNEAYTAKYLAMLDVVPDHCWEWLANQGNPDNEVTILCFCRDEWFCHTHIIIDYATEHHSDKFTKDQSL